MTTRPKRGEMLNFVRNVIMSYEGKDCLIWPYGRSKNGYGQIHVKDDTETMAHRYVCKLSNGPSPKNKPLARHTCGKGHLGCVSKNHLSWGDYRDNNLLDRIEHNTHQKGSNHSRAKLNENDIIHIREMIAVGVKIGKIALKFSVSRSCIYLIKSGKNWKHVKHD